MSISSFDMALNANRERLPFYSPVSFLRDKFVQSGERVAEELKQSIASGACQRFSNPAVAGDCEIIYRYLSWDSDYFGAPTYRVEWIAAPDGLPEEARLIALIRAFIAQLETQHSSYYVFSEAPSEDIQVLRALTGAGIRLIETRLTYYHPNIAQFAFKKRFAVRLATVADREPLKQAARAARNVFDRFHADPFFPTPVADEFLATYISNSLEGYADIVLVPDVSERPAGGFLTANYCPDWSDFLHLKLARMVLSAVTPEFSGWYTRLIAEMSYLFQDQGVECAFMTTQSTNRAVVRVWEKLGYSLGRSTHVLAAGRKC